MSAVRVVHPSGDLLYIPNFISKDEEAAFVASLYGPRVGGRWVQLRHRRLMNIGGTVDPKGMLAEPIPKWVMQPIGERIAGVACPHGSESGVLCSGGGTEETAQLAAARSEPGTLFDAAPGAPRAINHVLVNEYLAPHGIMAHEDGPAYAPLVAIVSFESAVVLRFRPKCDSVGPGDDQVAVVLMPRSLVVFKGEFYEKWLHVIEDTDTDVVEPGQCLNLAAALGQADEDGLQLSFDDEDRLACRRGERRISATYRHVLKVSKLSTSAIFGK